MRYNIKFKRTVVNRRLEIMAVEMLHALSKKFNYIKKADVFFQKERGSQGKGIICEIRLNIQGSKIYASSSEENFVAAISETISNLEKQLKQPKDEMLTY